MATYGLTLVTAPASEPISLDEAAVQCGTPQDSIYHQEKLLALITAAREKIETDTGRAVITQTWDYTFDLFPYGREAIYIPKNPVSAISSVKYYDTDNVQQTLSTTVYKTFLDREPAEIRIKRQQQWPFLWGEQGVITVRFVAGYGTALAVPQSLKLAMLLLVGSWFEDREAYNQKTTSAAYDALIAKYLVGDEFHIYGRELCP